MTTYRIVHDPDCTSPRENDNLGTFWTFHRRYESPDPNPNREQEPPAGAIALTVYMYDHSGVTYSTTPFHCPWDSGPVGFIFVEKSKVLEEYGVTRISPQLRKRVEEYLKAEVEEYAKWAEGDCWGYEAEDGSDSCWGFIGRDVIEEEIACLTK